jgi:hypothetical protein
MKKGPTGVIGRPAVGKGMSAPKAEKAISNLPPPLLGLRPARPEPYPYAQTSDVLQSDGSRGFIFPIVSARKYW